LAKVHEKHVGYLYYKANNGWMTGLRYLIWDKLNAAMWWLDDNDYSYGSSDSAVASYHPGWNDMTIQRNPDPYIVMHEAIHAYNDWVDKHEASREDEGLAYAAAGMAEGLERLQRVETALSADKPDLKDLRVRWLGAWLFIDRVGWPAAYDGKAFTITVQDIQRVNSHLAFKVRCQDVAALYNKQPGAKKACVEFLCTPNAKTTKGAGWTALTPKDELHEPFK
jgi:hypothetical protein